MKLATSFLMVINDKTKIDEIDKYTDYVHFDIMDGKFTENETDLNEILNNTRDVTKDKDVHLMVMDIKKYVDLVKHINPKFITFHLEATDKVDESINYIKDNQVKVGLAINPKTNVESLLPYLHKIDLVLVMSVQAGKGGQAFIDISSKINYLIEYREKHHLNYLIEVDGGIKPEVIDKVKDVDIIVVGSFITNGNIKEKTEEIRRLIWEVLH